MTERKTSERTEERERERGASMCMHVCVCVYVWKSKGTDDGTDVENDNLDEAPVVSVSFRLPRHDGTLCERKSKGSSFVYHTHNCPVSTSFLSLSASVLRLPLPLFLFVFLFLC